MTTTAKYTEGIGRRKSAVARVRLYSHGTLRGLGDLKKGEPVLLVNERAWTEYFPIVSLQTPVRQPFEVTGTWGAYDVTVHIRGGGIHAQADAVKLGCARALEKLNPEFRRPLRDTDLLSRDPREKERKKPGLKRARRAPQWQKR
jgi:small subunit ribosomal protein S9